MPMPKPPFPAQSGLFGKPTVINNNRDVAMVPLILTEERCRFPLGGHRELPGTKTFALTGHVANASLIEVPFGAACGWSTTSAAA